MLLHHEVGPCNKNKKVTKETTNNMSIHHAYNIPEGNKKIKNLASICTCGL
jgi:hypothetical protein